MSRYTCVTEGVIEKCQQDYLAGRDLRQSIPGMSATKATIIATESLEADRLLETLPQRLLGKAPPEPAESLSDWSRAILAGLFFEVADMARARDDKERQRDYWALAWAMLEEALESPTASPMLWYEDIYLDVAQEYRVRGDRCAVELMKQGLAHDLRYHEGMNADGLLRDLAETYLWVDELDRGLAILAGLLRNDPSDIWTYNVMAIIFDRFGLADLGLEAAQRGLELLEAIGDPEELHEQLTDALNDMQQSERRGREAEVDPTVLADFCAALALDFGAGQRRPVTELCWELVPDLDRVPVKCPAEMPELLPPPALDRRRQSRQTGRKLRRNDPCWCGSGKKYKHCHMRSDRSR